MAEADLQRFAIPGTVWIGPGRGGLTTIEITTELATAQVYLHGAHVTHFQPRGAEPVLFLASSSYFARDKAIRGGIPIIFPWFGARAGHPESPAHGFARVREWKLEACSRRNDGAIELVLTCEADARTLAQWPGRFSLRYTVAVSKSLELTLEARNLSTDVMEFEEALHTYLRVGDVRKVGIFGLEGVEYLDKTEGMARKRQGTDAIQLIRETDRVYLNTTGRCVVKDPILRRSIRIEKQGSAATVLWNPWIEKAKAMADFGNDEWPEMLCVESANVADAAVKLAGGQSHAMRVTISVER